MKQLLLIVISFFFYTNLFAQGEIINVPGDQPTIQAAINTSVDGDTVLVADGTYFENINYNGKAITLASWFLVDGDKTHIDSTIINGSQPSSPSQGSVVFFLSGEDTTSVLCGFTITGGTGDVGGGHRSGGGIIVVYSGAKIINNKIINNSIRSGACAGAGIMVYEPHNVCLISNNLIAYNEGFSTYSTGGGGGIGIGRDLNRFVIVENNVIAHNSSASASSDGRGAGGGIDVNIGNSIIRNNLIVFNQSYDGGGLDLYDGEEVSESMIIENNTIAFNHATNSGGGIYTAVGEGPKEIIPIKNNILWGNTAGGSPNQIFHSSLTNDMPVEYSLVQGGYNGIGNIDLDPLFADTTDFYLDPLSPCVDAGSPNAFYNDLEDPNNLSFALFPALGGLRNDMGAYGGNPNMILIPNRIIKNSEINDTYFKPGIDVVIVTSSIDSPEDQLVIVKAIFENENGLVVDSVAMLDDGLDYDEIANDGIFTGHWPTTTVEDNYLVHISTHLTEYYEYVIQHEAARFTTAGPLVVESFNVFEVNDSLIAIDDIVLANLGTEKTVGPVSGRLVAINPCVKSIPNPASVFGSIAPGVSKTSFSTCGYISNGCPDGIEFELEISSGDYVYWKDTLRNVTDVIKETVRTPTKFALSQNYPNPFNPTTKISYSIPKVSFTKLIVYDLLGREIKVLVNEEKPAGNYEVNFDASGLSSGVYFYKLTAGKYISTKKLMLLK